MLIWSKHCLLWTRRRVRNSLHQVLGQQVLTQDWIRWEMCLGVEKNIVWINGQSNWEILAADLFWVLVNKLLDTVALWKRILCDWFFRAHMMPWKVWKVGKVWKVWKLFEKYESIKSMKPEHKERIRQNPFSLPPSQISGKQIFSKLIWTFLGETKMSLHWTTKWKISTHHKLTVSQHNLLVCLFSLEHEQS